MLDSEFMFMEYTSTVNRIGNITVVAIPAKMWNETKDHGAMMAFDLEV